MIMSIIRIIKNKEKLGKYRRIATKYILLENKGYMWWF